MKYDFDQFVERRGTNSAKWDSVERVFGEEDLLPMWVADSDWPTAPAVVRAIKERAQHGIFGYTFPGDELREVVTDWLKERHDWEVDPDWISFNDGVVPSLSVAIETVARSGDGVVIQPPVYYPFFSAIRKNGAQVVENPLREGAGRYEMDFRDLERTIDERGERGREGEVRALVLCSPHNPVGRVWKEGELKRLGQICGEREVVVIADEIHSDIVYPEGDHLPFPAISGEFEDNSITLFAPSKTFNIAGLPASVTVIPDPRLRKRFLSRTGKRVNGPSIFGMEAMRAAYEEGQGWLEEQLAYLADNRDFALSFLEDLPQVRGFKPEGTYLLWIDFRPLGLDPDELRTLIEKEARVALDPGQWFGQGGTGFMRLNMACPRSTLREGLERIGNAVEKYLNSLS